VYWNATNFLISFILWRDETIADFKLYCKVLYIFFKIRFLYSISQFIVRRYKSEPCSTHCAKHRCFVPSLEIIKYFVPGFIVLSSSNTTHTTDEMVHPFNCGYCKLNWTWTCRSREVEVLQVIWLHSHAVWQLWITPYAEAPLCMTDNNSLTYKCQAVVFNVVVKFCDQRL
jgi:hypothetical protein